MHGLTVGIQTLHVKLWMPTESVEQEGQVEQGERSLVVEERHLEVSEAGQHTHLKH